MPQQYFFILLLLFFFNSCQKQAGEGGTSAIIGRVKALDLRYDGATDSWEVDTTYYLSEERVYIIYGDDEVYSDDFRTDPNGYYRFQWLRKGKYKIFAYSDDTTGSIPSGSVPKYISVEIVKNKTEYNITDLEVLRIPK
ncbi:MAG: hypothetical protein HY738_09730 [Bacteroidia bacterium]|nr:hypothetical protein [Bacteroidia bacterium]